MRYNQSLTNQLNNDESEIEDFFNLIISGETIIRACKSLKLDFDLVNSWITKCCN